MSSINFIISCVLSFVLAQHATGEHLRAPRLQDLPALKKYQVPFLWNRDGLRTGLKFRDIDDPWAENRKRSHHWGSKPQPFLNEIELEDDPEKIKLDHNYKTFVESDEPIGKELEMSSFGNEVGLVNKRNVKDLQESVKENSRVVDEQADLLNVKNNIDKRDVEPQSTGEKTKNTEAKFHQIFARLGRAIQNSNQTLKKEKQPIVAPAVKGNVPSKKPTTRQQIQTHPEQNKRQISPGSHVNNSVGNHDLHVISLNGDKKPHASVVDVGLHKQLQEQSLVESKKQAMKILKLKESKDNSQDNGLNEEIGTLKVDNPIKNKVHDHVTVAATAAKTDKDGARKPAKRLLTPRTKIELPSSDKDKAPKIVPANVARAVAMAMEQLKRDRMWGKVFIHVLPSGKLKVMVQETKKIPD